MWTRSFRRCRRETSSFSLERSISKRLRAGCATGMLRPNRIHLNAAINVFAKARRMKLLVDRDSVKMGRYGKWHKWDWISGVPNKFHLNQTAFDTLIFSSPLAQRGPLEETSEGGRMAHLDARQWPQAQRGWIHSWTLDGCERPGKIHCGWTVWCCKNTVFFCGKNHLTFFFARNGSPACLFVFCVHLNLYDQAVFVMKWNGGGNKKWHINSFGPKNLEVSYNSVINACAQTGYVERAEMWREGSADGGCFHRTASLAVEKNGGLAVCWKQVCKPMRCGSFCTWKDILFFFFVVFPNYWSLSVVFLFFLFFLSVDLIFLVKLRNRIQRERAVIRETFSFGDIFDLESILYQPDFRWVTTVSSMPALKRVV